MNLPPGLRVVLFDVYETLLLGQRIAEPEPALRAVVHRFGLDFPPHRSLHADLRTLIEREHAASSDPFPEIDIRELWRELLPGLGDSDAFALAAEEAVHPVRLAPGALELIDRLHHAGLRLGIVSNAQAYTRTLLARHLGSLWAHFDPALLFFSYEHRTSKPGPGLFQLALRDLDPSRVLMIGDSEPNDLAPARSLGLHAAHIRDFLTP